MRVKVAAVKIRIGQNRLARHIVERDVLRRQFRRGGDDHAMADSRRIHDAPRQRLHAAERAAHHCRKLADAERIGQACLRVDPILDRDHRKIRAVRFAGCRVDVHRTGGPETRSWIIDADDKKLVGVERLAWSHHVVPPAEAFLPVVIVRIFAGDMVRRVQRVAHQYRIRVVGVQGAVGFIHQRVAAQGGAALQGKRRGKMHRLR